MNNKLQDYTGLDVQQALRLLSIMKHDKEQFFPGVGLDVREDCEIFRQGLDVEAQMLRSVPFAAAAACYVTAAGTLRHRSQMERQQICRRLLNGHPELGARSICVFSAEDCRRLLQESGFATPAARNKARRYLHGLFNFAVQQEWCAENPVALLAPEPTREQEIRALTLHQVKKLVAALRRPEYNACAAAVSLMLWAGIRPQEVTRLHWGDLDLAENMITMEARHTKTGGPRHIPIRPVLHRHLVNALLSCPQTRENAVVPANWNKLWRQLRAAAGLSPWRPDTLRHTFASYHLKYFDDLDALMADMGHSNADMLRTRYLNMRGLTAEDAAAFWYLPALPPLKPRRDTPAARRRYRREKRRQAAAEHSKNDESGAEEP